jgi:putative aldouronate transport system permease protein
VLTSGSAAALADKRPHGLRGILADIARNPYIYLMLLPAILFYLVFFYAPMFGVAIAFKDYSVGRGIFGSPWIGLRHFRDFFQSYYFWRLLRNTILINFYDLLFGFPAPIIFALLLNELRGSAFKRTVQTVTYMPHFISTVVVCGMLVDFLAIDGLINNLIESLGVGKSVQFLQTPEYFRSIYVGSGIWQELGWGSIIYLAALTAIDPQLYDAAEIDGAGRWRKLVNVTLSGILPTIIVMLILRVGRMMNVGAEKVLLLYNPTTYETGDVISTFVYRKGLLEMNYGYSAAVGLFNSAINFALLVSVNRLSRGASDSSLW